jgi:hypothetical protein
MYVCAVNQLIAVGIEQDIGCSRRTLWQIYPSIVHAVKVIHMLCKRRTFWRSFSSRCRSFASWRLRSNSRRCISCSCFSRYVSCSFNSFERLPPAHGNSQKSAPHPIYYVKAPWGVLSRIHYPPRRHRLTGRCRWRIVSVGGRR